MILEVFCMQFDTYAPCICRGYRSFLPSMLPSFRIDRRARKRPHGLTRGVAATVNRCIRPGLSPAPRIYDASARIPTPA